MVGQNAGRPPKKDNEPQQVVGATLYDVILRYGPVLGIAILAFILIVASVVHYVADPGERISFLGIGYVKSRLDSDQKKHAALIVENTLLREKLTSLKKSISEGENGKKGEDQSNNSSQLTKLNSLLAPEFKENWDIISKIGWDEKFCNLHIDFYAKTKYSKQERMCTTFIKLNRVVFHQRETDTSVTTGFSDTRGAGPDDDQCATFNPYGSDNEVKFKMLSFFRSASEAVEAQKLLRSLKLPSFCRR